MKYKLFILSILFYGSCFWGCENPVQSQLKVVDKQLDSVRDLSKKFDKYADSVIHLKRDSVNVYQDTLNMLVRRMELMIKCRNLEVESLQVYAAYAQGTKTWEDYQKIRKKYEHCYWKEYRKVSDSLGLKD